MRKKRHALPKLARRGRGAAVPVRGRRRPGGEEVSGVRGHVGPRQPARVLGSDQGRRGAGNRHPLTPEYQAVYEANIAKDKAGLVFDPKFTCGPVGMPRVMNMNQPMEFIIKPTVIYMLMEIAEPDPARLHRRARLAQGARTAPMWAIQSASGSTPPTAGTYDTLEIETRAMKGLRLMDNSGIPLASDEETVVKEKILPRQANPDVMHNEITTIDHAFTRPWTVSRFYKRVHDGRPQEYNCAEDNRWVVIGWPHLCGGRGGLSDADPEGPTAARSEIVPEISRPEVSEPGDKGIHLGSSRRPDRNCQG